jgi:putative hydrolase of the HAD superfamily
VDAVALDLGGVLVQVDFTRCLARLSRMSGLPQRAVSERIFDSGLKEQHDLGRTTSAAFAEAVVRTLPRPIPVRRFLRVWGDIFELYPLTRPLITALQRSGIRFALFSNTDPVHIGYIRARWQLLQAFDALALSYELHVLKPDPSFFRRAARVTAVRPSTTLFVDDRAENVLGAQRLGYRAVRARGPGQALRAFQRAGLLGR